MGAFQIDRGRKYKVVIEAFGVYCMGGYVRLSDKPQQGKDDEPGLHYMEVPEYLIVKDPKLIAPHKDGLLFEDENGDIWKTHEGTYRLITGAQDTSMPQYTQDDTHSARVVPTLKRIYREGEI